MLSAIALLAAAAAATPPPPAPKAWEAVEADWVAIPDDELLVMTLAGDRRVFIRLAPRQAPVHVENIRKMARAGWWDGTSVYRVQDGWVAQWGGGAADKAELPGIVAQPPAEYDIAAFDPVHRLTRSDAYSTASGVSADGWPIATDGKAAWLTHCYASVGVARGADPDTGSGAELFTVIGQAARRLDRNYAMVGRIVAGMEYLSALPRSSAEMGFYEKAQDRAPILSVRLAADMPAATRPHYQYRAPGNARFSALIARKENPPPPTIGLGGADICDIPLEVRATPVK